MSVRAAAEERAQTLALRDPLTGFHNRRSINETGSDMLIATRSRRDKAVAMIMLDLDHFKNVNDVHGHAVGDALLRAVATRNRKRSMPPNALQFAAWAVTNLPVPFLFDKSNPRNR